ncbi:MAG: hypothetical protein ACI86H_001025 [bacterium]|jgi:uncharacterized protein YfaA (DUF2138 family)
MKQLIIGLLVGIVGLGGFLGYQHYQKTVVQKKAQTQKKSTLSEQTQTGQTKQEQETANTQETTIETFQEIALKGKQLNLGIPTPDGVLVTQNLANFPKDIIENPTLKKILTEKFLFYYEGSESHLSLKGTLRRITFENQLSFKDHIVKSILDQPAEIAFWKGHDGRLSEFIMIVRKSPRSNLMTLALSLANKNDRSFKSEEDFFISKTKKVKVYSLKYGKRKKLYFTGIQNRYYFFTRKNLMISQGTSTEEQVAGFRNLYKRNLRQGIFSPLFGVKGSSGKHTLIVNAKYLSFGYQRFFPSLRAFSFTFRKKIWATRALVLGKTPYLKTEQLWKAFPKDPSLCVALPVDASRVKSVITGVMKQNYGEITKLVESATGICWYQDSGLYTPLLAAKVKPVVVAKQDQIEQLFRRVVYGKSGGNLVKKKTQDGFVLEKVFTGRKKQLNIRFAYWKGYFLFSLNGSLVDRGVNVLEKKMVPLFEQLKGKKNFAAIIFPKNLSEFLTKEITSTLKKRDEITFLNSAKTHLFPTLKNIATIPSYGLSMPIGNHGQYPKWEKLEWHSFEQ